MGWRVLRQVVSRIEFIIWPQKSDGFWGFFVSSGSLFFGAHRMGPPGESDGKFPWHKLFTIHRIRKNGQTDGQYIKNEKSFRSMYPQRPQFSHSLTDHCPSDHRTKKQAGTSSVSACLNHLSSKTVSGPRPSVTAKRCQGPGLLSH